MPDALLVDLLPGGLEIENFNLTDAKQWADIVVDGITITDRSDAAEVRHEEFRDDRYVAALKLDEGQAAHVFYLVRAVSPGTYRVPPALVEDMYRPEVRGIGKSDAGDDQGHRARNGSNRGPWILSLVLRGIYTMRKTTLTSKGQLVIPKPVRDALHLKSGTRLSVTTDGDRIVLEQSARTASPVRLAAGAAGRREIAG